MSIVTRFCERADARRKALSLSTTSGKLRSDHMGPNHHRVKVGWEADVDWRSYWMKSQQPVCAWSLKTAR